MTEPVQEHFRAIGTEHRVLCTNPDTLADAVRYAQAYLAELDRAVSRFRPDSEVSRLSAMAEHDSSPHGTVTVTVSDMFADHVQAALTAARLTGGLVDPTVGRAVAASGYDDDMDVVRARQDSFDPTNVPNSALSFSDAGAPLVQQRRVGTRISGSHKEVPGWRRVEIDGNTLTVPRGCLIDLGATAKAHAADVIAATLGSQLPGGFLINLGGDIAVGGDIPQDGWQIGVEAPDGSIRQAIYSTGQAVTTSSTQLRTWSINGELRHHIVDPRTGLTADAIWAQVTCAAASALEANAASTAAIVLGRRAPGWLTTVAVPARLDGMQGQVLTTPGWPAPAP